jgi:UDP-N-acetylmuramoylalanine--D-glutamate ligase
MLKRGGIEAVVAGNIGKPLTEAIQGKHQWIIAELSSFQLKGTHQFCPKVAALLNLEEAHLDYHQEFADYVQSKQQIFKNQTETDYLILNQDAAICREASKKIRSHILWFSRLSKPEEGIYLEEGIVTSNVGGERRSILPVKDIALPGVFNLENALAATAIACACGCPISGIQDALRTFRGVEHRLEYVKVLHGVHYYNDSKATNIQATKRALESFQIPIIWLAGGLDRGTTFSSLVPMIKKNVKQIIAFGETKDLFQKLAKEAGVSCLLVKDLNEAVYKAKNDAIPGDVVLLSPACASWDMYTSFEERGSIFKQAVHTLK